MDNYNSHCTLEVVRTAKDVRLDLITLPSHTSHALQPLDVAVSKPFKQFFCEYRDFWMSRNINQPARKETLAHWVSLSLRKALSESNIRAGFKRAGIYPLNRHAVDRHLAPSETYDQEGGGENQNSELQLSEEGRVEFTERVEGTPYEDCTQIAREEEGSVSGEPGGDAERDLEANLMPALNAETQHFFVDTDPSDPTADPDIGGLDTDVTELDSITRLLQLPTFTPRAYSRRRDSIVDFAKSIIFICNTYEEAEVGVRMRRENAGAEKERHMIER